MTIDVAWRLADQPNLVRTSPLDLTHRQFVTTPGLALRMIQEKHNVQAGRVILLGAYQAHAEDHVALALITQGVDYAIQADKAFMARRQALPGHEVDEARATAGQDATAKALAIYLDVDEATAEELILKAVQ